jgi:uncharacterized membrane protein YwaF
VVLAIFVAGTVGLLAVGPHVRYRSAGRRIGLVLAIGNLGFGVASTGLGLVPFKPRHSLPLQICDFAWIVVAVALLTSRPTPRPTPTALTYYWGLTLSVQALVQPTLTQPFPQLDFFVFWGKHVCIVWGARCSCVWLCATARTGAAIEWPRRGRSAGSWSCSA